MGKGQVMAETTIRQDDKGAIRVLSLSGDRFNTMTPAMIADLRAAFADVADAADVAAVVLCGSDRIFCRGGARDQIDALAAEDGLIALCREVEACAVPVVCALAGTALGPGAELALAAHYRVGAGGARFGLTDINLALPPMAGSLQRLARCAGLENAADLALTGRRISADEASQMGLLDALVEEDAEEAALVFATALLDEGLGPRPAAGNRGALAQGPTALAQIELLRRAVPDGAVRASYGIVECLESAILLPYRAAQVREADLWDECRRDMDSRALFHLAEAEDRIAPILMARGGGKREVTQDGAAVVQRLREALSQAGQALRDQGFSAEEVDAAAVASGVPRGPFGSAPEGGDQQLGDHLIAALVAEGARLVEVEAVARASDVDVLAVRGLGLPRRSGGPMFQMQTRGPAQLLKTLREWGALDPIWAPCPLLVQSLTDPGALNR